MFHRSRVHPIWPSNMCNYSQKEMGVWLPVNMQLAHAIFNNKRNNIYQEP